VDDLGVGLVWFPPLADLIEERGFVDVVEVEPQIFWTPSDFAPRYRSDFARLQALPAPKIAHGVGLPVGTPRRPPAGQVERFARDVETLGAIWASEHLSFLDGFLLPPRQTKAAVAEIAESIRHFQSKLRVPFAIETGVNYLRPRADEMSDGAFVAAVAEAADCAILLDLHNLWANERNGRQRVAEFLDELPLERVIEVHFAGGEQRSGYWLDAHCGATPQPVLDLAAKVLPELSEVRALIFEIMPESVARFGIANVRREIEKLRRLWDGRRRSDAREWEDALGALATGQPAHGPLAEDLAQDPGVAVLRDLVNAQRAGAAIDSLKLTTRLLRLSKGDDALKVQFEAHWSSAPPLIYGVEEAASFAEFLDRAQIDVPHFREVLALERALLRIHRGGAPEVVHFSCDPAPLLSALSEGRLPDELPAAQLSLRIGQDGAVSLA
jgi:uncharacterized protein (UPF0276 family)